jgi:hypothetical protein
VKKVYRLMVATAITLLSLSFSFNTEAQSDLPTPPKTGEIETQTITTQAEVGSGDIQVALSWDNLDDVDLWLTEPSGETIYYSHRTSQTGGRLDLDAQAGCTQTAVSTENIFWPQGQAPSGEYTVKVKLYRRCGTTTAQWRLNVSVAGQQVLSETGSDNCPEYRSNPSATPCATYTFRNDAPVKITHVEAIQVTTATATQLEIGGVEVNLPLIAYKPTMVRVYLDCNGTCPNNVVTGVTATIKNAAGDATLLKPYDGRTIEVHDVDQWEDLRDDMSQTLNFILPREWTNTSLKIIVNALITKGANLTVSDTYTNPEPFPFTNPLFLDVLYVPFKNNGKSPVSSTVQNGHAWAWQVFPISEINYVPAPGGTIEAYGDLSDATNLNRYYDYLYQVRTTYRYRYIVGWLPDGALGITSSFGDTKYGEANPNLGVAFVTTLSNIDAEQTFAHEMGHLFGLDHANTSRNKLHCSNKQNEPTNWPWLDSTIQQDGIDLVNNKTILPQADYYDFMSYCKPLWISPYTYYRLWQVTDSLSAQSAPIPYVLVTGFVNADNTASFSPIKIITTDSPGSLPPAGTQYCLEFQNSSNAVLSSRCVDLDFRNDEGGEAILQDMFSMMLPRVDNMSRIVLKKDAQEIAVQPISANAPVVTVISPNGGENWLANQQRTISWNGSDQDGDSLYYDVDYSVDGQNWFPIAINTTATQLMINSANLQGSNNAFVRVRATDGFNTSSDISNAAFHVAGHTPTIQIVAPSSSISIISGAAVFFQALASDFEDGTSLDTQISWSSNRDGNLGIGNNIVANSLSLGQHTITAKVTDSEGKTSTATRLVTVGALLPPSASPVLTSPLFDPFIQGTVTFAWGSVSNASSYQIQVASTQTFSSPSPIRDFVLNSYTFTTTLVTNQGYWGRVRAWNAAGAGPWSAPKHFTIDNIKPSRPVVRSPTCSSTVTANSLQFQWSAITGISHYELQVETLNPPTVTISEPSTNSYLLSNIIPGIYYWRVRSVDAATNASDWTTACRLTVTSPSDSAPIYSLASTLSPTLSWSRVDWASQGYELQIASNIEFENSVTYLTNSTTLSAIVTLPGEGIYYWRVRALGDNQISEWSTTETIAINLP